MRVRILACALVLVAAGVTWVLAAPLLPEPQAPAKAPVNLGAFTQEIMVVKIDPGNRCLAMWMPFQFFVEIAVAGGADRQQSERDLEVMRPYHVIMLQIATTEDFQDARYATLDELRARAVLRTDEGEEIPPADKLPARVRGLVREMTKGLAASAGAAGASMHVLMFPTVRKDGRPVVDPLKRAKLTLVVKADDQTPEARFVWRTPFDSLNPGPPCAKCRETVSSKWFFCPWCGAKLEETKR